MENNVKNMAEMANLTMGYIALLRQLASFAMFSDRSIYLQKIRYVYLINHELLII